MIANLQRAEKLCLTAPSGRSIAVQIGKLLDVTSSARLDRKESRVVRDELKLDAVINYKTGPIGKSLRAAAPKDRSYFDNVGGIISTPRSPS
jgi:NADPH-dependent curcumin reductase CurA